MCYKAMPAHKQVAIPPQGTALFTNSERMLQHYQIFGRLDCGCVVAYVQVTILNVIWLRAGKLRRLSMMIQWERKGGKLVRREVSNKQKEKREKRNRRMGKEKGQTNKKNRGHYDCITRNFCLIVARLRLETPWCSHKFCFSKVRPVLLSLELPRHQQ